MDLKPAATDAFAYIAAVKDQLQGEPDKYQELINTLIDFQGNRIDKNSMLSRVKVLLAGCPELILGFNEFLSTSCALNIQEDKRQRQEDKKLL